jgi:hypothetical protein
LRLLLIHGPDTLPGPARRSQRDATDAGEANLRAMLQRTP